MAAPGWWTPYIRAKAKALGLDPAAVLAVARQEGMSGRVGDGGHAFGPFQLNDAGGVLTGRPGNHRAFAESRAGIDWAMQRMAQVAGGERGAQAVHSLVYEFERPQDKAGEAARALASYGKGNLGGIGGAAVGAPSALGSAGSSALGTPAYASALSGMLNEQMNRLLSGDTTPHPEDTTALAALVGQRNSASAAQGAFGDVGSSGLTGGGGNIAEVAKRFLGVPYKWGGNDPKTGLDCSSFVQQLYAQQGIKLPRTTYDQVKVGQSVNLNQLRPGDLIFTEPGKNGPNHVGVYVGGGKVQQSPHTGTVNSYIPLTSFLGGGFVAAKRVTGG